MSDLVRWSSLKEGLAFSPAVYVSSPSLMNPAHATLNAVSRLRSLRLCGGVEVRIWRMSFVIGSRSDLVEGKNDLPPANRSFNLGDSNGDEEYSWSMC